MTREVFTRHKGKSSDAAYHLFEDCARLVQARGSRPVALDSLSDDTDCCILCIKRAFLRKEACSVCDADSHALDLATLEPDHSVQWPCPEGGFTDEVPVDIFRQKLDSVGLDVDDVREAANRLDVSGPRGPQLSARLEEMQPGDLVTDGGQETTIYLAGPVAAEPDGGAAWRNELQEYYGDEYDFRDPLAKYNVKADELAIVDGYSNPDNPETVGIDEVVENDLRLIDESDGILVGYSDVASTGTPMEVMYARERDMPVALWVRDETDFDGLPIWYQYHSTALTTNPEMGLRHIERQSQKIATDGGRDRGGREGGMSEDEVWDCLEELYRGGDIDHVPGIGSDVEPAFTLSESGERRAENLLRENDEALLYLIGLAAKDALNSDQSVAQALVSFGALIRDDVGVNVFRVMKRHSEKIDWLDIEGVPEEFVQAFDPEEGEDA